MAASQKSGGGGASLYYEIANFQAGMDLRKSPLTAPAGTLRALQNAHITQGGEIEKRSAFVKWCQPPVGSIGLCSVNNQVYTHLPSGTAGFVEAPTPTSVGVIHISQPPGDTLAIMTSFDVFNGLIYATFLNTANSHTYHYYNGLYLPQATDKGSCIRTYKEKVYGVQGRVLYFSAVGDPTIWQDPPPDSSGNVAHNGSGFIDVGANDADSESLIAMEVYYDKMAIFSLLSCQLWFLDPDPSLNQYFQTLRDAGTLATNSVRQYVANDVYFLGTHGIRSLRARDLTTTAAVADVGSAIDAPVQDLIAANSFITGTFPGNSLRFNCKTILSPRTGRVWVTTPNEIFVLSNWASPNISAWSTYLPEFTIDYHYVVYSDPYVILRATDGWLYRFGAIGDLTYDSCPVRFTTPFLSFDKPATFKFYQGFDAICTADTVNAPQSWNVQMSFNPLVFPVFLDTICTIDSPTIMDGRIPVSGRGTHVLVSCTHQAPGPATFSKMFIHYAPAETS